MKNLFGHSSSIGREELWENITASIDQLWSTSASVTKTMELYTYVYEYVVAAKVLHIGITLEDFDMHLKQYIQSKLNQLLQELHHKSDEELIPCYQKHRDKTFEIFGRLNVSCAYLDRGREPDQFVIDQQKFYYVHELCEILWKESVLEPLVPRYRQACLTLIDTDRQQRFAIQTKPIADFLLLLSKKRLVSSFAKRALTGSTDDYFVEMLSDASYERDFEQEYLQKTDEFYRTKETTTIESAEDAIKYSLLVIGWYDNEIKQANLYLPIDEGTQPKLIDVLERRLLPDAIRERVRRYLSLGLSSEIESVNKFVQLNDSLTEYFETQLRLIVLRTDECVNDDTKAFVGIFIDYYQQCLTRMPETVINEPSFRTALDRVCVHMVNQVVKGRMESAELLARHCHSYVLSRRETQSTSERDSEEELNKIMVMFNYLDDKDIFLRFYEKLLQKRLIAELSASDELEESMISRLQEKCGHEYTAKLKRMLQDVRISGDLTEQFRPSIEHQASSVHFAVLVLTSNSWSFSVAPSIVLPDGLKVLLDQFTQFYLAQHQGRKLHLLHQHSRGELQMIVEQRRYRLQVSTYQMIILLLFNEQAVWTVEQIQDRTQINEDSVVKIIDDLVKRKILKVEENISTSCQVGLSDDFISEKVRIDLNTPMRSKEGKKTIDLHSAVSDERRMTIQAAIVRIMKSKTTLKYNLLISEVIAQLQSRFKANVALIKKCIDTLIDKEYLQRDQKQREILCYFA